MTGESDFIVLARRLASDPAARGLLDDAAVLELGTTRLVLTHDMIAESVHFLPGDAPGDVAWKLLAVNLSDLAGKGARPIGALLGYSLAGDADWDAAFLEGLQSALTAFGVSLLGGDTVAAPVGAPRTFGLTAIGEAAGPVPSRAGAHAGDILWVSGMVGDAGAGLRIVQGEIGGSANLVERYRLPRPRLEAGEALAPLVSAMMDISDGLLLDASRLAQASKLKATIELHSIPLSADYIAAVGENREARLAAASAGDDYELLFTAPADCSARILALSEKLGLPLNRIGHLSSGAGLILVDDGRPMPLPAKLGFEHGHEQG